jgi:phosphohistidine phosphatase SixA
MKKIVYLFFYSLIGLFACTSPSTTPPTEPTAYPIFTALTSDGQLLLKDSSLMPIPHYGDTSYLFIYLIRHCEKESQPDNPPLSTMGQARAERIGRMLDNAVIDRLCVTNTKRTIQTAEAIKYWAGDPAIETFPVEAQSDWLLENLQNRGGRRLLYVGHVNSIPALLNQLTQSKTYKNIPDPEYNHFYIVATKGIGQTEVLELRY